jgi:hypothetical protein
MQNPMLIVIESGNVETTGAVGGKQRAVGVPRHTIMNMPPLKAENNFAGKEFPLKDGFI